MYIETAEEISEIGKISVSLRAVIMTITKYKKQLL